MSGLFSKPKVRDVEPMPDPQAAAEAARREQLLAARKRAGRASTILSGDMGGAPYSRSTLGTL